MNLVDITSTSSEVHKRDSSSCALIKLYFAPPPPHRHIYSFVFFDFLFLENEFLQIPLEEASFVLSYS